MLIVALGKVSVLGLLTVSMRPLYRLGGMVPRLAGGVPYAVAESKSVSNKASQLPGVIANCSSNGRGAVRGVPVNKLSVDQAANQVPLESDFCQPSGGFAGGPPLPPPLLPPLPPRSCSGVLLVSFPALRQ